MTTTKRPVQKAKSSSTHYIDNQKFNTEVAKYCALAREAKLNGQPKPRIPEYIGHCFLLLAKNISLRAQFRNYPFIEDMISDGVDNCLSGIASFDPVKSNNPFGYFTITIFRAFIRRIGDEKKRLYRKFKLQINALNTHATYTAGMDGDMLTQINTDLDYINSFMKDYEDKQEEKKKQ